MSLGITSAISIQARLRELTETVFTVGKDAETLEGRLRAHAIAPDELSTVHKRISACYADVQEELHAHMNACTNGTGYMISGFDGCFFEASSLIDNISRVYKKLCHASRTLAPEYVFLTPDIMASERKSFASLLAENRSSATEVRDCIIRNGLNPDTLEYRSILGDGNCFYSSIAANILDSGQVEEFLSKLPRGLPLSPDFLRSVIQFIADSKTNTERSIHETNSMMQFVRLLRELAVHELFKNPHQYENHIRISLAQEFPKEETEIWTEPSYETLVDRYTREMGKEASFMTIVALSNFLSLPVIIHQINSRKPLPTREAPPIDPFDPHTIHVFKTGEHYYLLHTTPGREPARFGGGASAHASTDPLPSAPPVSPRDKALAKPVEAFAPFAVAPVPVHTHPMTAHFEVPIDVGMGNRLVLVGNGTIIRNGEAVDLSWDAPATNGIPLACSKDGKFWSIDVEVLVDGECKICLVEASGKVKWSSGTNKPLKQGSSIAFPPEFA